MLCNKEKYLVESSRLIADAMANFYRSWVSMICAVICMSR